MSSVVRNRRRFLGEVGAGLATPWVAPVGAWAARARGALAVRAVETDLTSDNERMISYRHQQHLVQTDDGALHLLFNRGTLTPGPGLSLYSSDDGGVSWRFVLNFANTGDKSTADVLLDGGVLSVAYHTAANALMFAQLQYDAALRQWSVSTLETAYASTSWAALNPALAMDALGTVWIGFLAKGARVGNLRVVCRPAGGAAWADPGLVFGPTDGQAVERSARPLRIGGGIGMVWTVHEVTYWSHRGNDQAIDSPWTASTVYVGTSTNQLTDPYASHFNVAIDDQGGLHLLRVDNYDVLYFRYAAAADSWGAPLKLDDARKVAYAQIGIANGKLAAAFSVQRGKGQLSLSGDGGTSWQAAADLALLPTQPGINFNTARVEMPARASGVLPILQQYAVYGVQRLMLFQAPVA